MPFPVIFAARAVAALSRAIDVQRERIRAAVNEYMQGVGRAVSELGNFRISVSGTRQVSRRLRKISPEMAKAVHRELQAIGRDLAKEMRAQAPRGDTGALRKAITTRSRKNRHGSVIRIGVRGGGKKGVGDAYYWRFLEFGTSKMPARPFIRPVFEASKSKILRRLEVVLGRKIRTIR